MGANPSDELDRLLGPEVRKRIDEAVDRAVLWGMPVVPPYGSWFWNAPEGAASRGVDAPGSFGYSGPVTRTTDRQENEMPATNYTTSVPASDRQLSYIEALRAERGMAPLSDENRAGLTGGRNGSASRVIEALLATPRTEAAARREFGREPRASGELLHTPVESANRAARMILAGRLTATVTAPNGEHYTLELRSRRRVNGRWQTVAAGTDDSTIYITSNGRRVASVASNWTARFSGGVSAEAKQAVRVLFGYLAFGSAGSIVDGGEVFRVQEESRCGRCGRQLTDPQSIDRGIGPECYGRLTRSRHGQVVDPSAPSETVRIQRAFAQVAPAAEVREVSVDPTRSDDVGFGGCDYDEHCGACSCCAGPAPAAREATLSELAEQIAAPGSPLSPPRVLGLDGPNVASARDTIELALKLAVEDEAITQGAANSALATFDRLAAR